MDYLIENDFWQVRVASHGAELQNLKDPDTGLEYLWQGDPAFWAKRSPVLFPIVGALKEGGYYYEGRFYSMGRHGFARDREFRLDQQEADFLSLVLDADDQTRELYPFDFRFTIDYRLQGATLDVQYRIDNRGDGPCYFSVGGHPAFRLPLFEGDAYRDYFLAFNQKETASRWPVTAGGCLGPVPVPFLENADRIDLDKSLFSQDAIVLKNLNSSSVRLCSRKTGQGFEFDFSGFPYLGIWAAKNADFVCIEPWCGIADSQDSDQQLIHKEGIQLLPAGQSFERTWSLRRC
ncbi:aldose 1-epimerase family protein [Niabella terrae]